MSISCHILTLTWLFKSWFGTVLSYLNLSFLICKKEAVIHCYLVQHCESERCSVVSDFATSGLSCHPPGDLPNPEIEPRSPEMQVDSLPAEPLGKPKNTGVGRPSLLHLIFPTQDWTGVSCIAGRFFTNWAIIVEAKKHHVCQIWGTLQCWFLLLCFFFSGFFGGMCMGCFFFAIIGREALGVDIQQMAYLRIKILLFMGVPLRIACSCI